MPKSEASEKGAKLGEMFKDVGILGAAVICYLLALFVSGPSSSTRSSQACSLSSLLLPLRLSRLRHYCSRST